MVCQMYSQYACPSAKIVYGLPTSWDPVVATIYDPKFTPKVAWSPCSRFIAVAKSGAVNICDAATLNSLSTFKSPSYIKLQALTFSPDGNFLAQFNDGAFVTWDLQTGASVGITFPEGLDMKHTNFPCTYSMDGRMIAVVYYDRSGNTFIGTHNLSTTHTHLYSVSEGDIIPPIWTNGEVLQFATLEPGDITIWEVDFTLANKPRVVKSFVVPIKITGEKGFKQALFLPGICRLGIVHEAQLFVWDTQGSKFLLNIRVYHPKEMTFSSNGHFFACTLGNEEEVHVWREAPAGYTLHQKLVFSVDHPSTSPLLSPDGGLIIIPLPPTIHLWHTKDPIFPSHPTVNTMLYRFTLGFSPNKTLAAFARQYRDAVIVLDLRSGDPQLVIDTGMEIEHLGLDENTIVVVDKKKIVSWALAIESARANVSDNIQTTTFDLSPLSNGQGFITLFLSPDLSLVVISWHSYIGILASMGIYDVSNGRCLAVARPNLGMLKSSSTSHQLRVTNTSKIEMAECAGPFFTPDGHEICCVTHQQNSPVYRWQIVDESESGTTRLQPLGMAGCPSVILPWQSSFGYTVTDDGWILSSTQKRLLWLPPRWRSYDQYRIWSGEFLGLRHPQLAEPVIIQFLE